MSRIIAYILAANIIQKKDHFDELSGIACKAVYAITKNIPVNWSRVIIHCMTHVKTKLFFGPLLTYLFIHYDVPLTNKPSLSIRTKPLDNVAIEKMELALERSRRFNTLGTSTTSTPGAQGREEHEDTSEEEDDTTKEDIEALRKEIIDIKL